VPEIPPPRLKADRNKARAALSRWQRNPAATPVLGLCPGAEYGPAKRWPAEYFAEVAKSKLAEGWEVWLFGSDKDKPETTAVQTLTQGRCFDLGGQTSLAEAIDLLSLTSAVVTNDSGLMHVAAALDRPVVALYGSSDPRHTPPMTPKDNISSPRYAIAGIMVCSGRLRGAMQLKCPGSSTNPAPRFCSMMPVSPATTPLPNG